MKKIILLIGIVIMLIAAKVAFGQQQEGVISYDMKVNLHRMLPPDRQDEKAMIPEYRTAKQQLFYNGQESLYKPLPEEEDDDESETGGGNVRMRIRQPHIVIYSNQEKGEMVTQREFMGKNYLIVDTLKMPPWKMGEEKKTILGYNCSQAYYTDEENKQVITAWFTDQLRQGLGPDRFQTLPGTVLAVDINNGERITLATKIDLRPLKKSELKAPTTGTPISRTDFRKMVDEQVKKNGGHGGRMIIRN